MLSPSYHKNGLYTTLQARCQQLLGALSALTRGLRCQWCWTTIAKSGKSFGKKADADTLCNTPVILCTLVITNKLLFVLISTGLCRVLLKGSYQMKVLGYSRQTNNYYFLLAEFLSQNFLHILISCMENHPIICIRRWRKEKILSFSVLGNEVNTYNSIQMIPLF